jgi:hypothetical protein
MTRAHLAQSLLYATCALAFAELFIQAMMEKL